MEEKCHVCGEREVFREDMCVICFKINKHGYGRTTERKVNSQIADGKPVKDI